MLSVKNIINSRAEKGFAMSLFLITMVILGMVSASLIYNTSLDAKTVQNDVAVTNARILANAALDDFYGHTISDPCFIRNALGKATGNSTLGCTANGSNYSNTGVVSIGNFIAGYIGSEWVSLKNDIPQICTKNNQPYNAGSNPSTNSRAQIDNSNTDYHQDCYIITLSKLSNAGSSQILGANVKVMVRSGCFGNQYRCKYTTFNQIMRQSEFYDYLSMSQYSLLDPNIKTDSNANTILTNPNAGVSSCSAVTFTKATGNCTFLSYLGSNTLNGPVYSGDDYLLLCGNSSTSPTSYAQFNDRIDISSNSPGGSPTVNGTNYPINSTSPYSIDICNPSNNSFTHGINLVKGISFPSSQNFNFLSNEPNVYLVTDGTTLEFQTLSGVTSCVNGNLITPSGVATNCASTPLQISNNSIFYDTRNLSSASFTVSGIMKGHYSFISYGNINIGYYGRPSGPYYNGLEYCNNGNSPTASCVTASASNNFRSPTSSLQADTDDSIGIYAGNSIVVTPYGSGSGAASNNSNIDALLVSLNGELYASNWADSNSGVAPTLTIFGSLVGEYQSVTGTYISANGSNLYTVTSGFDKSYIWDSRFTNGTTQVPPYLLSPNDIVWTRLTLSEIKTPQ